MYQNVQYFIRSKKCIFNFTKLRFCLHKAVKQYSAKNDIHVSLVFPRVAVVEEQNFLPSSVVLTLVIFLFYRVLRQKIISSKLSRRWSSLARSVALLGLDVW